MDGRELEAMKTTFEALNIISVIFLVPTLAYHFLSKQKRAFPGRLLTYVFCPQVPGANLRLRALARTHT
jgi:hypothetical protein